MPSPVARLHDAVNDIQGWLITSPNPGEAVVRQAIVLRLLQAAGFDIWNPTEVVPEETNATGNRADFLIRAGAGKFALEIKGMGVTLGAVHFQQAATYAVNEGTRWAIVTNGRVWIVIDEHLPGKWEERVALRVELAQEGETFADDLATLLDAETWRADAFAGAVDAVQQRQRQRRDEARIQREKRPVVEALQAKYQMPTFELAAENAVEAGKITEAERDVLLGRPGKQKVVAQNSSTKPRRQPPIPILQPHQTTGKAEQPAQPTEEIHFTYRILEAVAHAVYCPADGTWTVKAGSTLVPEVKAYATGVQLHREQLLSTGQLLQHGDQIEYTVDVVYPSPSAAAGAVSGGSKNGWDVWIDDLARPAQFHRPKNHSD
ncbi:DUF4357 domain-containing protein [Deinococcus sp. SDU3-2]|uniref:DUF4357 domain-containing protein n=1 Tax=Deinococcus terrestris TaxID=2651870 RepID=A0A7X1TR22_9DEIO|nr:DUF4357 domain-containing protein [Deinococcus terrestris]MPY66310.1 DUF4357 domain-containing protein [Deinococcus terrestris]